VIGGHLDNELAGVAILSIETCCAPGMASTGLDLQLTGDNHSGPAP
jgi:hypothetical protein